MELRPTHLRLDPDLHLASFLASICEEAKPYAALILVVSNEYNVDPFLIAAIGQQESRWTRALGPDGTGDFAPRAGRMPSDGLGWGRGIMQVDYGSQRAWLEANNWRDAGVNVRKGVEILLEKAAFLRSEADVQGLVSRGRVYVSQAQARRRKTAPGDYRDLRPLNGGKLVEAAVAAYNTGQGNVLVSIVTGTSVDSTTAHQRYSTDVMTKMWSYAQRFNKLRG